MSEKSKAMSAEELMNLLNKDAEFKAASEARDGKILATEKMLGEAQKELLMDLASVGCVIDSVWDLVNVETTPIDAIPVLLDHLERGYPDRIREGIARALAVPEAIVGWEALIKAFCSDPDKSGLTSKAGVACALAAASNDEVVQDVVDLVMDEGHGENRILLLSALARSSRPSVREFFLSLRGDPTFKGSLRCL